MCILLYFWNNLVDCESVSLIAFLMHTLIDWNTSLKATLSDEIKTERMCERAQTEESYEVHRIIELF